MNGRSRREFLAQVGQGVMVATVGYSAARELGLSPVLASEPPERLNFGVREALVSRMQETPADKTLPMLVKQLQGGTPLQELVAAAALANARTFGGEDYIGFHTFMALAPAWQMARQLPESQAALPVFKVLYRNASRMEAQGGSSKEVLHPIVSADGASGAPASEQIRQAVRNKEVGRAEQLLAVAIERSPEQGYNELLPTVEDAAEVHRTVLAYRVWDLLDLVGREHATTLLRQSLHYCVDNCGRPGDRFSGLPVLLPKLLDQYRLVERPAGTRVADDAWLESTTNSLLSANAEQAADLVAAALADGIAPQSVADAIALVANQFVLRDPGRTGQQIQPNKPAGSVHGDSVGVHASDSVNAWRHIARVSDKRNSVASLVLSGWQIGNDKTYFDSSRPMIDEHPHSEQLEKITKRGQSALIDELNDAIRQHDQARACAVVAIYGQQNFEPRSLTEVLLRYAISEDGALHAEKYYNTATEEFRRLPEKFRWRELVALARVTASEYGQPAPGMDEARQLIGVTATS